jgi:argininosuccinate lyase
MTKQEKSWQHRLDGSTDELAVDFVESLSYDWRLYQYDIVGSIAHARMLAAQKIITKAEFEAIQAGLVEISEQIAAGKFVFDKTQEDIHMAVESALIKKIGDPGRKLHTGRSRNDQVATDIRLWMRDEIEAIQSYIVQLQRAFVTLAAKYTEAIMPAYTHLQRAQPVSIAAYLLSFVEQLARDYTRLADCRRRLNVCPLGSGAVAGTTLPLDRQQTARDLGFADITYNSIDAVADRDFCAEFIFCGSLIAAHLSRLAEDWILYTASEFSFIRTADAYCTSSSMMPQKRNPDMLELIRGKTGSVYGALMAMLTILKASLRIQPRPAGRQTARVQAADVVSQCLRMAQRLSRIRRLNRPDCRRAGSRLSRRDGPGRVSGPQGIPFRQAMVLSADWWPCAKRRARKSWRICRGTVSGRLR